MAWSRGPVGTLGRMCNESHRYIMKIVFQRVSLGWKAALLCLEMLASSCCAVMSRSPHLRLTLTSHSMTQIFKRYDRSGNVHFHTPRVRRVTLAFASLCDSQCDLSGSSVARSLQEAETSQPQVTRRGVAFLECSFGRVVSLELLSTF